MDADRVNPGLLDIPVNSFWENMMKNSQEMDKQMGDMQEHRHMLHQHMQAMKDGGMMGQGAMGDDAKSGSGTGAGKEQKDGKKHK